MEYKIIILPRAEMEILRNYIYYESKQKLLGSRFTQELDLTFNLLKITPYSFSVRRKFFREVRIRKFPFLIIYKIEDDNIIIFSVFNTHQKPSKKP